MNGIGFQLATPANGSGGKIPMTIELAIASGYSEAQGALLVRSATGTFEACGTDPTEVGAVALDPGGADTSGFNILGRKEFPSLTMRGILVAGQKFWAPYQGTVPTAVDNSTYGVTRATDGVWKIDFAKVGGGVLAYHGFPDKSPADAAGAGQDTLALVSFLPGVIQAL